MIKKSLKYLIIVLVNIIILTVLLAIWTDKFELEFNNLVRPFEFLKLIGISVLGLIYLRIAISIFRFFKIYSKKRKIGISILLILLISGYFYIDYSKKIYNNRIVNGELRKSVMKNVQPLENGLAFGTKADNLTTEQYQEITRIKWFPKLQKDADSISYYYTYDGFLPDYEFQVSYSIPKEIEIDTTAFKYGKYYVEVIGNRKKVTYNEYVD